MIRVKVGDHVVVDLFDTHIRRRGGDAAASRSPGKPLSINSDSPDDETMSVASLAPPPLRHRRNSLIGSPRIPEQQRARASRRQRR